MKLKIGELAKLAQIQAVTIRYYEKEGLLEKPDRTGSNYRIYEDKDIERLRFIRHCRRHGMTLSEIRELLAFKDKPTVSCDWINTLVETHIANVDKQITSLRQLKAQLEHLLRKCAGGKKEGCGIIESLSDDEGCPYCENLRCKQEQSPKNAAGGAGSRGPDMKNKTGSQKQHV